MPLTSWLIIAIYIDSTLFVFVTAIISKGLGINDSRQICEGAILLCLICYMTTKVLIYFFLVEKAYIIRGSRQPRMKDRLYLFNFFGMIVPYLAVIVLNFIFRIAYINQNGVCIIGMKKVAMLPLISFDVLVNIYLTMLFLIPLRKLYSYQHNKNTALRKMALRTFVGSCATLASSVVNLTVLMVLKGEPGWICLMCCNADILFSALVLHWITALDSSRASSGSIPAVLADRSVKMDGSQLRSGVRGSGAWNCQKPEAQKPIGTVTTEIIAESRDADSDLELDKIRVQTEQTREVEIDGRSENSTVIYQIFPGPNNSTDRMV
ncbi:hypothetical protein K432DRAFT_409888 [Lepidopterella palustris CBS 459.81]|uniref:Transmembrane protein n=1 Tax=Lepidopterella palustris CBS 459.81 TaxID=1314670 RepID=A0A8E2DZ73_9PEZI|nr:hypothetical protein K432DRAFT_409888 [Lepidopterella palustris CBS 459.81]